MIDAIHFRCRAPDTQAAFYSDTLGMKHLGTHTVGYGGEGQARLIFAQCDSPYLHSQTDLYWKIAISVPDLDLACKQLNKMGVQVDGARQFRDIGYLAHIVDPQGFKIELIQHVFEGEVSPHMIDPALLGGGPAINLLTLRASEIGPVQELCEDLGMRQLCLQPVAPYDFDLHFFALTDERPPNADLLAVENRSWLYQRPYTLLEIQHLHEVDCVDSPAINDSGYAGFLLSSNSTSKKGNVIGLLN